MWITIQSCCISIWVWQFWRCGQFRKHGAVRPIQKPFTRLRPLCICWHFICLTCCRLWFFFSVYAGIQGYYSIHEAIFVFLVSAVLSYARFIEPHLIQVKTTKYQIHPDRRLLKPVKIALIADLHIGLFSGHERQLKQIVKKLNLQNPDIVVVAGDWTYEPENKLVEELAVLKEICAPVYSVNGNHDEQYPGPPIQELLKTALEQNKT